MNAIKNILLFFLIIFGFFIIFPAFLGDLFRKYSTIFFIIWIITPIFATTLRYNKYSLLFKKKHFEYIKNFLMVLSVGLSFLMFFMFSILSESYYYIENFNINTSNWYNKLFLWINEIFDLFEYFPLNSLLLFILLAICFLIPIITWKQCSFIDNKLSSFRYRNLEKK